MTDPDMNDTHRAEGAPEGREPSRDRDREPPRDSEPAHLFDLGRLWARYGLDVAELALEASARTLRVTADVLGGISESLEDSERAREPEARP